MIFTELSEPDYRAFWENSSQKSFLSAPEMSRLNPEDKVFYFGVKKDGILLAAAMVRARKNHIGLYRYSIPGGPLINYHDQPLLRFFLTSLKQNLKHGISLSITPNIIEVERDKHGEIIPGGDNNKDVIIALISLGFLKKPFNEQTSSPNWLFVLPLNRAPESTLLANMKQSTRQRIKQALARGIKTRTLTYEELPIFYRLLESASKEKNFPIRSLEYFQKMYNLFAPQNGIRFELAYLTPDIPLATGMFMTLQPEVVHLFGANNHEYLKLGAQYALQWEMIKFANVKGYKAYNFYGVPENLDKSHPAYGVYEFKRGFSGQIRQLIGEFELPLSPLFYGAKLKNKL